MLVMTNNALKQCCQKQLDLISSSVDCQAFDFDKLHISLCRSTPIDFQYVHGITSEIERICQQTRWTWRCCIISATYHTLSALSLNVYAFKVLHSETIGHKSFLTLLIDTQSKNGAKVSGCKQSICFSTIKSFIVVEINKRCERRVYGTFFIAIFREAIDAHIFCLFS